MIELKITEEVRSYYSELQGYLSQFPIAKSPSDVSDDFSMVERLNGVIDKLQTLCNEDLSRFKVSSPPGYDSQYFLISQYRTLVGGLISRLHAKFFSNEPPPFSGMPSTVNHFSQSQTQNQSQNMQLVMEVTEIITKSLANTDIPQDEKTFLQKVKEILPTINGGLDLVQKVSAIAAQLGMSIEAVSRLLR
ncbi:MAG: hypothetical protein WCV85_04350 [Patescibacteria group bacterium]|jgi:hypothetical protein